MNRQGLLGFVAAAALCAAGCGGSPTRPTPQTPPLAISCPVAQSAQSLDGNPVLVTYPNPTPSGGEGVSSISCTPPSGSRMPVGTTTVSCTVQDTKRQTASCSFQVTVTRVPTLAATRFTAFGDSMTEGFLTTCPNTTLTALWGGGLLNLQADLASLTTIRPPQFSAVSYPVKLQGMLRSRFSGQAITVSNQGSGGETVATGVTQLPGVLSNEQPQVLLLLEGINDINQLHAAGIPIVVNGLRTMVQEARRRGISVFLGTLLPQRRGSCRSYDYSDGVDDIVPANTLIRQMAGIEGVPVVDLYQGFAGSEATLIGPDGLHPNEAGYQRMADLFYAAILQRLER